MIKQNLRSLPQTCSYLRSQKEAGQVDQLKSLIAGNAIKSLCLTVIYLKEAKTYPQKQTATKQTTTELLRTSAQMQVTWMVTLNSLSSIFFWWGGGGGGASLKLLFGVATYWGGGVDTFGGRYF